MFHTFIKQIGLLLGHTFLSYLSCATTFQYCSLLEGNNSMIPFLLSLFSLVMLGGYILWTVCYFFAKRKIITTDRIVRYYTIVFIIFILIISGKEIFDITTFIFILSVTISSAIIYFLNKVLNENNFNKLIS